LQYCFATRRLLEAARAAEVPPLQPRVHLQLYGRNASGAETVRWRHSPPYGVTKGGAENLCRAFEANFHMRITILRYFSVYWSASPRGRDMASQHPD
jgi:nucleoside-diphosphate-sugar epimerase